MFVLTHKCCVYVELFSDVTNTGVCVGGGGLYVAC